MERNTLGGLGEAMPKILTEVEILAVRDAMTAGLKMTDALRRTPAAIPLDAIKDVEDAIAGLVAALMPSVDLTMLDRGLEAPDA